MQAQSPTSRESRAFEQRGEDRLRLFREVLSGRVKMTAKDYIELVSVLNAPDVEAPIASRR